MGMEISGNTYQKTHIGTIVGAAAGGKVGYTLATKYVKAHPKKIFEKSCELATILDQSVSNGKLNKLIEKLQIALYKHSFKCFKTAGLIGGIIAGGLVVGSIINKEINNLKKK